MFDVVFPHAATAFAGVCACIFVIIGVLGNLITILALLFRPKMRGHATTAFVLSLCISDLLFCSVSLPLTAIRYFKEAWTLGDTLCEIFPIIFYGNVAVSLLSMVGIALNRYILISWNSLYTKVYSQFRITVQLIFIWAIPIFILLLPILGVWGQLGLDEATFSCTIIQKDGKSIKKALFLVGFVIPCVVIIVSYTCIYLTVRRQKQILKSHSSSVKTKDSKALKDRENSRLTVMMFIIFICFLICFLPLMLVNVMDEHNTSLPWLHIVSSVMAWASSVIDPFVYAVSNRTYRVAYYKVFALLKFWEEPLNAIPSKILQPSKNSRDQPGALKNTVGIEQPIETLPNKTILTIVNENVCADPLSPMPSKILQPSENSNDQSGALINSVGIEQPIETLPNKTILTIVNENVCADPLSPMPSKILQPSENSNDQSGALKNSVGIEQPIETLPNKPTLTEINENVYVEPLSPMPSKILQSTENSREQSGALKNSVGIEQAIDILQNKTILTIINENVYIEPLSPTTSAIGHPIQNSRDQSGALKNTIDTLPNKPILTIITENVEPLSPMPSKILQSSKNSRDKSVTFKNTVEIELDINNLPKKIINENGCVENLIY